MNLIKFIELQSLHIFDKIYKKFEKMHASENKGFFLSKTYLEIDFPVVSVTIELHYSRNVSEFDFYYRKTPL